MWERLRSGRHAVALIGIVAIGLVFRAWGLPWGLRDANVSRRPHPDEWAVYWLIRWFDVHHSLNPCPSAPSQCFFDWGTVFPYGAYGLRFLLSPVVNNVSLSSFGANADPAFVRVILVARLFSVIVSTSTIVVVYCIGRSVYSKEAGLIAALLTALSGLLIQLAHFATPDTTTGFLLSLALLTILQASRRPSARWYGLAGVSIGLCAGSEYHMVMLVFPLIAGWALSTARSARYLLLAAACALGACLACNPFVVPEFQSFLTALEHTVRIRTVDSRAQYQDRWSQYNPPLLYVIRYPLGYGVGIFLTVWFIAGLTYAGARRRRRDLVLLAWIIPYCLLVTITSAKFMRYSAPLLPAMAVLGGSAARDLLSVSRGRGRVLAYVSGCVALMSTGTYDAAYAGLFSTPDPRTTAAHWIATHAPSGSEIAFEQLPNGLINLPYYVAAEGYQPCFSQFRLRHLANDASFLAVDNYSLEEHPLVTGVQVRYFRWTLQHSSSYQLVAQFHDVPTFLGVRFPIDASPHDWRYPSHVISIYRHVGRLPTSKYCYPNLAAATAALYSPAVRSG